MFDLKRSASEKKFARCVYEEAREKRLAKFVAEFKARATSATSASHVWAISECLHRQGRELDQRLDFRYSRLPLVLAQFIHEGYLEKSQISGLSEDKRELIRRLLSP